MPWLDQSNLLPDCTAASFHIGQSLICVQWLLTSLDVNVPELSSWAKLDKVYATQGCVVRCVGPSPGSIEMSNPGCIYALVILQTLDPPRCLDKAVHKTVHSNVFPLKRKTSTIKSLYIHFMWVFLLSSYLAVAVFKSVFCSNAHAASLTEKAFFIAWLKFEKLCLPS